MGESRLAGESTSAQEILRKIPFFTDLAGKDLKLLAKGSATQNFRQGEVIVREGEEGLGLYFILSGKAGVVRHRPQGEYVLATLGGGEFFGELSLLDAAPRSADVIAIDETECLILSRAHFRTHALKIPDLAWKILQFMAKRLRDMDDKILCQAEPSSSRLLPRPTRKSEGVRTTVSPQSGAPFSASGSDEGPRESLKSQIKGFLLTLFKSSALLRMQVHAFTAITGCPVTLTVNAKDGSPPQLLASFNAGGVEVRCVAGNGVHTVEVEGEGRGRFDLTLIQTPSENTLRITTYKGIPTDLHSKAVIEVDHEKRPGELSLYEIGYSRGMVGTDPWPSRVVHPSVVSMETIERSHD